MRRSVFVSALLACCLWLLTGWFAPAAFALTQLTLSDLAYRDCPPELATGAVTSGGAAMSASCYIIYGKAQNDSGRPVLNADIFGRVYDANGNSVMQNRTRLGSIDEVPPGISDFEFTLLVPANQPTPLQLKQFKAAGFTGKVRR